MASSPDPTPLDWARVRWDTLDPRHGALRMERVLEHLPAGGRHLDVGTGNGDGTALAARRTRCVGVEYGPTSAARAAARGCTVARADARRLPFPPARFDSVTCLDVLEHVPRPERALAEIARVLRPGGLLVLQTPNRELFKERVLRLVRALGLPRKQPYDRPLARAEIRRLIAAAGLAVEGERPIRCWDDQPLVRAFSWSRLFLCRRPAAGVSAPP